MGRIHDRKRLAAQHAAHVEQFREAQGAASRLARLAAVRKRQQQRVDYLVHGKERPSVVHKQGKGRGKIKTVVREQVDAGIEPAVIMREEFGTRASTPETADKHRRGHHAGSLQELFENGTIDREQWEWGAEIANVHRSIESDVAVTVASLEARVDNGGRRGDRVAESVRRVRLHAAYTVWRDRVPAPKQLVLDMIVGDTIGYTVAAKRYGVHNRKAKRLLIEALDRWPTCVAESYRRISEDDVERANAA